MNKNVKRYNIFFVSSNNIIIKRVIVHLKQRNFSKFLNQILQESHFPFIQRFINSIISAYPFHYSILLSISIYFYLKNPFTWDHDLHGLYIQYRTCEYSEEHDRVFIRGEHHSCRWFPQAASRRTLTSKLRKRDQPAIHVDTR